MINSISGLFSPDLLVKLNEVHSILGTEEMLSQMAEESSELGISSNKMRRAEKGITPMSAEAAAESFSEEVADVLIILKALEGKAGLDDDTLKKWISFKINRWHARTLQSPAAMSVSDMVVYAEKMWGKSKASLDSAVKSKRPEQDIVNLRKKVEFFRRTLDMWRKEESK